MCEGQTLGVFDLEVDVGETAEEKCCGDLAAGAYYDTARESCCACLNGKCDGFVSHVTVLYMFFSAFLLLLQH